MTPQPRPPGVRTPAVLPIRRTIKPARMRITMDVTDATFETDVLDRSTETTVVVDLWASWCGPCRTLGPTLEKVVDGTPDVELVKVDVDANPRTAATFQVQSIPAVYAIRDRKVVDSFIGALPEPAVRQWVAGLDSPSRPRPTGWSRPATSSRLRQAARPRAGQRAGRPGAGGRAGRPRRGRPTGRRPSPCWPESRRPRRSGIWPPRPGWVTSSNARGRGDRWHRGQAGRPAGPGARPTTPPARSSSTCSNCSARRSAYGCLPQGPDRPSVLTLAIPSRSQPATGPGRRPPAPPPTGDRVTNRASGAGPADL